MKEPLFKIPPASGLQNHLSVGWHCVDQPALESEAAVIMSDRFLYQDKTGGELIVQYHIGMLGL